MRKQHESKIKQCFNLFVLTLPFRFEHHFTTALAQDEKSQEKKTERHNREAHKE